MKQKNSFTIVELLVVIAIIGIIMGILLPALSRAREVGKRTACLSNLRQIGTGIMTYKTDNNMNWVPWTSLLYPDYISSKNAYHCPSDLNKEINKNLTDNDPAWLERIDGQHSTAYDRPGNSGIAANGSIVPKDVGNVSYFYEMSDSSCDFDFTVSRTEAGLPAKSDTTWAMWKEVQLNHGGDGNNPWGKPYSVSAFPIYRCFWHLKHVKNYASPNTIPNEADPVINITYSGSYILTRGKWELGVWNP